VKIAKLKERLLKRPWVLKTAKGMKGAVQLLGSLLVSDEPKVAVNTEYSTLIYYDPFSPESDSDGTRRVEDVTRLLQHRLLHAFNSNFQGDAGLQALESNVVRELEAMCAEWGRVQLLELVKDGKKVQPINPFATQSKGT